MSEETAQLLHVYIVEDSPLVREILISAVEAAGAEVDGSTGEAKRAIGDVFVHQPDLIFIDIKLNSGTGIDVLKALHENSLAPNAVKVVLTNFADNEYEKACRRLGADAFFDKSFETLEAMKMISSLAEKKRHRGAARISETRLSAA